MISHNYACKRRVAGTKSGFTTSSYFWFYLILCAFGTLVIYKVDMDFNHLEFLLILAGLFLRNSDNSNKLKQL